MSKKLIIPEDLKGKYHDWHYAPAVASNGFLFVSGCTGKRLDGSISDDITEQIRQAFVTVKMSLDEAGITFSDVVELISYHVGLNEHMEEFMAIRDEFISEKYPAWTAIGVSELSVQGAKIEVRVTAQVTEDN